MPAIVVPSKLDEWQQWRAPTQEEYDATPTETRIEWGERFKPIVPETYQKQGPLAVYGVVNALVDSGDLVVRCKTVRHKRHIGEYRWIVEYRPAGADTFMAA